VLLKCTAVKQFSHDRNNVWCTALKPLHVILTFQPLKAFRGEHKQTEEIHTYACYEKKEENLG